MSPRSLRGQLVLWLLPVHLLTTAIVGGVFYFSYGVIVYGFMDGQMRALAQSYASRDCADLRAPPPLAGWEVHEAGNFVVQLWCDGQALAPVPVGPALQPRAGWSDDGTWRVYSAPAPAGSRMPDVQVLQSEAFRREEVGGRALFASLSGLLLLPVALGVMVLVVGRASCRLRDSARQLAERDEHSGAPLAQSVPSEIAPLVQSFEGLLSRLREALGAQRRFVQDAAHELRTPLTALSLQLENLRPHLGKAGPEFAQLQQGMRRASHLVEQMLRLSRQDAAAAGGAPEALDLRTLLRASVAQVLPLADRLGVEIVWSDGIAGPLQLQGREGELRSLFDNLLDNALRHSPRGGEVELRLGQDDAGARWVDIADQGPGLPAAMRERVFDRFFRMPDAPAGGSGLGLAIARQAADRHGLRIELRDREDGYNGLLARVGIGQA